MRHWAASRTSGNFMKACAQLHHGFVLPRRGRGQGHMVDNSSTEVAGSHLLNPRTSALVTPGSF